MILCKLNEFCWLKARYENCFKMYEWSNVKQGRCEIPGSQIGKCLDGIDDHRFGSFRTGATETNIVMLKGGFPKQWIFRLQIYQYCKIFS